MNVCPGVISSGRPPPAAAHAPPARLPLLAVIVVLLALACGLALAQDDPPDLPPDGDGASFSGTLTSWDDASRAFTVRGAGDNEMTFTWTDTTTFDGRGRPVVAGGGPAPILRIPDPERGPPPGSRADPSWRNTGMRRPQGLAALTLCAALAGLGLLSPALADATSLEKQVREKTLSNGLKLIVLPRAGAPVVSCLMYADVGGVDENQNATGLAHVFEHMAFKGTDTIGTTDARKEQEALAKVDAAFLELRAERLRRPKPDEKRLAELQKAFEAAREAAQQYVVPNELGEILERAGAQGLNASTSWDQTRYFYSLPSNKLELWAATEADRFTNPVLREFYKEKDVVMEEKRMRESQPIIRLIDEYMPVAFKASMYRSFIIGHMSDLQGLTRQQAEEWFKTYYSAKNLTAVVVGDVNPDTAIPLLEKHLSKIPAGRKPDPLVTEEPPQRAEKRVVMEDPSQPMLIVGYKRPDITHPDDAVYDAIADILGNGRSSRLYRALVKEKQIALEAVAFTGLMSKYENLFLFLAVPNKGKTNAENEQAIYAEIERLKNEPVSAEELAGVKARAKAGFIAGLQSNMGLAQQLATAQNLLGDWREAFRALDRIDKVTAADVQRVAKATFTRNNRTVGMIENVAAAAKEAQ